MGLGSAPAAVVIGAGIGGLSAALSLAAHGLRVTVLELGHAPGGKMGQEVVDGVGFDTGPSLLTMPEVFTSLYALVGHDFAQHVELRRLDRAFRYLYPDGVALDIAHDPEQTLASVRQTLGAQAADELRGFLGYAGQIWEASAPSFVYGDAPSVPGVLSMGPRAWLSMRHIDAARTMRQAIDRHIRSPHLRTLLWRYATYNGSDVRRAPATLNCIAHVELVMGGWGVEGGMHRLATATAELAASMGVELVYGARVERVEVAGGAVRAVVTADGARHEADVVVSNADARHLLTSLLPPPERPSDTGGADPSMSGWTALIKASGQRPAPHTVLFPEDYEQEFVDIFDRSRAPATPTVYACDQRLTHGRDAWDDGAAPLFVMVNAPSLSRDDAPGGDWSATRAQVLDRLQGAGLIRPGDPVVWERSPRGLADRFPGSLGGIYGAASNSPWSAFRRPANRWPGVRGLYLASGSAHPGGGVPLCALSGIAASRAALMDLGRPERPMHRAAERGPAGGQRWSAARGRR